MLTLLREGKQIGKGKVIAEDLFNVGISEAGGSNVPLLSFHLTSDTHIYTLTMDESDAMRLARFIDSHVLIEKGEAKLTFREILPTSPALWTTFTRK